MNIYTSMNAAMPRLLCFLLAAVLAGASLTACDLAVDNENSPSQEQVLATPSDVQNLAGGTFLDFWQSTQEICGQNMMLSTMADAHSSAWANWAMNDMSSEPRIEWNNNPAYSRAASNEDPWYEGYEAISNSIDVLQSIERLGPEAFQDEGINVARLRTFVNLSMGLAYGHIASTYDQGFIVDENVDFDAAPELELRPYEEVMAFGLERLEMAEQMARDADFEISAGEDWVFGLTMSSNEVARLASSLQARYRTQEARTPQQRASVDWSTVLSDIESGLESGDGYTGPFAPLAPIPGEPAGFAPIADDGTFGPEDDCQKFYGTDGATWSRADYRTIGPAAESNGYQEWLDTPPASRVPFPLQSTDARITEQGPDGEPLAPDSSGSQFTWAGVEFTAFPPDRGTIHYSSHVPTRWAYFRDNEGPMMFLSKAEMDLFKAEALLRTGGSLEQVATLINNTRVENGALEPATADTPVGSPDNPPNPLASEGDPNPVTLWSMLKYEFGVETMLTADGLNYFADRGWGDLVEGTPLQFPVPGAELQTLGLQIYTFGGGGEFSAEAGALNLKKRPTRSRTDPSLRPSMPR